MTGRPQSTPARCNPADIEAMETYRRHGAKAIAGRIPRRDNRNLVIQAQKAGFPIPDNLADIVTWSSFVTTISLAQAGVYRLVAKDELDKAQNSVTDTRKILAAMDDDNARLDVTKVKLGQDAVAKAVAKLSEAERLYTAVQRVERDLLVEFSDMLRDPEVVECWRQAWRDLAIDESELEEMTVRESNALRLAASRGKPLLGTLYDLSVSGASPRERKRLKELRALDPREMPTLADVRAETKAAEESTPLALAQKAEAERKQREKVELAESAAMAAKSRQLRGNAVLT